MQIISMQFINSSIYSHKFGSFNKIEYLQIVKFFTMVVLKQSHDEEKTTRPDANSDESRGRGVQTFLKKCQTKLCDAAHALHLFDRQVYFDFATAEQSKNNNINSTVMYANKTHTCNMKMP